MVGIFFEMVPSLRGHLNFQGCISILCLAAFVCVFFHSTLWPRCKSSSCTMNHGAPKKCPFSFSFVRTKNQPQKTIIKVCIINIFVAIAVATRQLILPSRGIPFFFDLLLNRGIRWPQSARDLHGFENRQEITVSSCFVCERRNQLVWCLSRTNSGDLIDPDRYSWYIYIYQIYHSGGNTKINPWHVRTQDVYSLHRHTIRIAPGGILFGTKSMWVVAVGKGQGGNSVTILEASYKVGPETPVINKVITPSIGL